MSVSRKGGHLATCAGCRRPWANGCYDRPIGVVNNRSMDDIVRQALAKWPHVPDCYGWLGLGARGNWYMRDDRTQALGPFPTLDCPGPPGARGSLLRHDKLIEFIHRNYESDPTGRWFFQNGPQRVFVELEATPWIWRLHVGVDGVVEVTTHTGRMAQVRSCLLDEHGRLYLDCDLGFGLIHTQDVALAAEMVESRRWTPRDTGAVELASDFGYVPSPQAVQRQLG